MRLSSLFNYTFIAAVLAANQSFADEPVTVVLQNGLNGYTGTFDRRITRAGGVDGSEVSTGGFTVDGGNSLDDAVVSNMLIRFDNLTDTIPAGAKVIEAKLTTVTKTNSNAHSGDGFSVYRLTRPFDSNSSFATDFGADGLGGDVDMITGTFHGPNIDKEASVVSAIVTTAVQSWIDGAPNYGLGIREDRGTNGWDLHSTGSTANLRPKLEITYITGDDTRVDEFQRGLNGDEESQDIYLNGTGATSTTPGSTINGLTETESWIDGLNPPSTEPDISSMMRFAGIETRLANRKIESATLKLVTGFSSSNADSPGPFTVHRLLVPFTDTSSYGDFAGDAGAMLGAGQIGPAMATLTAIQDCEVVEVDISEAVRAWANGEPNYGLYIGSGTPNGWQIFTMGATGLTRLTNTDAETPGFQVESGLFRPMIRVVSSPSPVRIVSPARSERLQVGTPVEFEATATATAPATVSQVEFFLNGQSLGIDTNAPYSVSYPAAELGNYTLTAVMTDSDGLPVSSEATNFSVVPPAGLGGLYFDGLTDQVTLGDAPELKLSTFTIETWFRREGPGIATTTGSGGVVAIPLVAKGRNQADNSTLDTNWFLGIRESDGVLCADFEGATGTNVPVVGKTAVTEGEWQHAAVSFDGTELRLYLNGSLEGVVDANGQMPRIDSIQHASIATAMNSNGLGDGAFGGFMDEIRIWNTGRSQEQIRQTINSEVTAADGLVARFGLGEGTGSSITSSAPAAGVGAFIGAPIWVNGFVFNNNVLPSIEFTSPFSGNFYPNSVPINFTVSVADPDGSVAQVEYFDNGVSIGVVNSAPFSFSYANPPLGTHDITAEVTDNAGGKSMADDSIITYVTFPSPTIPGYTAGIIDGKDEELMFGNPAAIPAPWEVLRSTSAPRAFTGPGTLPGDIAANVNGTPLAFDAGVLFATNTVVDGNFASLDNMVSPYSAGGVYRVASGDNNGPGELEPTLSPESSAFSMGWFPYAQGWIGANIAADGSVIGGSTSLPASVTITRTGTGAYRITGLPQTGNLLAVSTGSANDNCATVGQTSGNWVVTTRDNNGSAEDGDFAILYIPVLAERVISGKVGNVAEVTPLNVEGAAVGMTSSVTPQGYVLTFGDGTIINPSNTALFVTADANAGNGPDNIWAYSTSGNSFVVFSHDLPGVNRVFQSGGFRFLAVPLDTTAPGANEVVLTATDTSAAEDGADKRLAFTVARTGSTAANLTVNYTVSGTATQGVDFAALSGTVTIPAGYPSAVINVQVLSDSLLEQMETVTLSLAAGGGYSVGLYNNGTGKIRDAAPLVETTTVEFQQGLNGYTGTFQKRVIRTISDNGITYTDQLGSAPTTSYAVDGNDVDANDMIRFDSVIGSGPGQVPAGARVMKAELFLSTGNSGNDLTNGPFIVDRLISEVGPSTTYQSISAGDAFSGVRGIMPSPPRPQAGFPAAPLGAVVAADVTELVRAWASGEPNYGLGIFSGGTGDGWVYATMGNANVALRPKLVVTYTTVPTREYVLETDQSAKFSTRPGTPTEDGLDLESDTLQNITNDSSEAMFRFPVEAIPADEEILKAELVIRTLTGEDSPSGQSVGPVPVRQVIQDWNTATSYGLYGTIEGLHVAEPAAMLVGLGQGSVTTVDVTSIVRSWRAGAPNFGVNIRTETSDTWSIYFPGALVSQSAPRLRITTRASGTTPDDDPVDLWADSFGASGVDLTSDDDGDGIKALIEYALGLSPLAKDVLPGITRDGNQVSISFDKGIHAAEDSRVAYEIWSSPNLQTWELVPGAVQTSSTISVSEPTTSPEGKKFYRLKVIYTP